MNLNKSKDELDYHINLRSMHSIISLILLKSTQGLREAIELSRFEVSTHIPILTIITLLHLI